MAHLRFFNFLTLWLTAVLLQVQDVHCVAKNYQEILNGLRYPDNLVFDITQTLNTELNIDHPFKFLFRNKSSTSRVQLSPVLYYRSENSSTKTVRHGNIQIHQQIHDIWKNNSLSLSFIFKNDSSVSKNNDSNEADDHNFTAIFDIHQCDYKLFIKSVERLGTTNDRIKSEWSKNGGAQVHIVHKYGAFAFQNYTKCYATDFFNVIILNVDIPFEEFILSYSQFKQYLRQFITKSYGPLQQTNPDMVYYIKLNLVAKSAQNQFTFTTEIYQKYYFYLLQYSVFWINDGERERIILDTFNINLAIKYGLDGGNLKDLTVLSLDSRIARAGGSCEMRGALEQISPHFNTISASTKDFIGLDKSILFDQSHNTDICHVPNIKFNSSKININMEKKDGKFQLITATNLFKELPIQLVEINSYESGRMTEGVSSANLNQLLNIVPANITKSCRIFVYFDKVLPRRFIQNMPHLCNFIWSQANIIIWELVINFPNSFHELTEDLLGVEWKRQEFLKVYSNKSVLVRLDFQLKNSMSSKTIKLSELDGLYCNEKIQENNELVLMVVNFAKLHNIPIEIKHLLRYSSMFSNDEYYGGWKLVETLDELNSKEIKWPVFVARNYPWRSNPFEELLYDPCIRWTTDLPKESIFQYMDINYAGAIVYMNDLKNGTKVLTPDELETMLLFVFHKFSLIEIVPVKRENLQIVLDLFSNRKFEEKVEYVRNVNSCLTFYLRVDLTSLKNQSSVNELIQNVSNLAVKLTGIHLMNWIHLDKIEIHSNYDIKLGLCFEDCVSEVNENFQNVKLFLNSSHQLDYLLCNIKQPIKASNTDKKKIEKYLDTTFFIEKYFKRMFPVESQRIQIFFQINSTSTSTPSINQSLEVSNKSSVLNRQQVFNFYFDIGRYASYNGIKFFMFPAFDDMTGRRFGWWKILDFDNLHDPANYIEKEAKYLNVSSWQPPQFEKILRFDSQESEESILLLSFTSIIMIALGTLVGILVISIICLKFRYQKQVAVLTKKEEHEFKYGKPEGEFGFGNNELLIDEEIVERLTFPEKFDIPKNKFKLGEQIGSGTFGLVYRANLFIQDGEKKVTQVAVKMPNEDFSKTVFKSMLSELKILVYIGDHPHVLGFRGAYIREISKGVVYIATELCENGSLQEHLRKLRAEIEPENSDSGDGSTIATFAENDTIDVDVFELSRFCYEIALGMDYISKKKIIHGDLSTRNVLLDGDLHCKIADFGLSRKLYAKEEYVKKSSEPLPWRWMAPESLDKMEFTTKSDVWGYSIAVWEIFSLGKLPYPGINWTAEFVTDLQNGLRMAYPKYSTLQINQRLDNCWNTNPALRPEFVELSNFFAALRNDEYIQMFQ